MSKMSKVSGNRKLGDTNYSHAGSSNASFLPNAYTDEKARHLIRDMAIGYKTGDSSLIPQAST